MSNPKEPNNGKEINFMSSPSLQLAVQKSKRKQTIKYIVITILTTTILLTLLFTGSQYILTKKIEKRDNLYNTVHGANISFEGTTYTNNLFSIVAESTYRKTVGDRSILWDKKIEKIPLFGKNDTLVGAKVEINSKNKTANRHVRYNDLNNERKIDFYYPNLSYDYLPQELELAVNLDENRLFEVALSFKEPLTITEVSEQLGHQNVNWLWVDTTTSFTMKKMENELKEDSLKTKEGGGAFGFEVLPETPFSEENGQWFIQTLEQLSKKESHKSEVIQALKGIKENTQTEGKLRINGVVVTGTATELKRFKDLEIIRSSVLGATIDKY